MSDALADALGEVPVRAIDELGIPAEAKEAVDFDGQVAFKGRYPEQIERAEPMRQARDESRSAALM
jgi:hypothetical protein